MKVLYHHRTASKDGQSTHIEEMVKAMRGLGHPVAIVAPAADHSSQSSGGTSWVSALKRHLPRPLYEVLELGYSAVAYRSLSKTIREFHPDCIYERYNLFMISGVLASHRYHVPLVLEVNAPLSLERRKYGGLALTWLADWAETFVWSHADAVLPVTEVLAKHMQDRGVPHERIVVIPNAVNPDDFRQVPSHEEAKARLGLSGRMVIGFIGFVREWDRLTRVVKWLAEHQGSYQPHLLVIGDGPARAEIEACALAHGVSDRVTFTGVVPRAEVPATAAAFDIALQTALVPYASPLCLFEYLGLGIATVAPNQPNHREIVKDHESAVLYEPEDEEGLEHAIECLCEDPGLRARVARSGKEVIEQQQLTWTSNAEKVTQLAARLLRHEPPNPPTARGPGRASRPRRPEPQLARA